MAQLGQFQPGEVLVADTTTPDWEPVMKRAAAIVTNRGGRTCHAAIIARELGIPGRGRRRRRHHVRPATRSPCRAPKARSAMSTTAPSPFTVTSTDGRRSLARPQTRLMVNLGNPELAFQTAMLPNDGVGLARMEFIVSEHIGVHPMALVHPEKIDDPAVAAEDRAADAGLRAPG